MPDPSRGHREGSVFAVEWEYPVRGAEYQTESAISDALHLKEGGDMDPETRTAVVRRMNDEHDRNVPAHERSYPKVLWSGPSSDPEVLVYIDRLVRDALFQALDSVEVRTPVSWLRMEILRKLGDRINRREVQYPTI